MNLLKIFAVFAVLLSLCNYEAEGGLTLLLLLKLVALKGALFLGAPLAFGAFLLGQGTGFLGGTILGGYTVLGAANKLAKKQKAKEGATAKPATVVVNNGWGAAEVKPVVVKQVLKATSGGWGWKAPKKPSLLARLTGIPKTIIRHYTRPKVHKKPAVWVSETVGWGWPAHSHGHHHDHHAHGHHHDHHAHGHHAHAHHDAHDDGFHHHGYDHGYSDAHSHDYGYSDVHSHGHGHADSHSHDGWVESKSVPEGWGWGPEEQGSDWPASSGSESQGYSSSSTGSGYSNNGYSSSGSSGRSNSGGYRSSMDMGYGPSPTSSSSSSSSSSSPSSDGYERRSGEATEQIENYVAAPSAVMEEYLEKKLDEEIKTTTSEERKKEASQLMAMLREVYIQELANEVYAQTNPDSPTTKLPPFIPIPEGSVPNSTTMKPVAVELTTLTPPGKSKLRNPFTKDNVKFVPIMETSFSLRKQGIHKNHKISGFESQGVKTFKEDVKKFFLLVSLLDQDSCLQKMVCDVHAKSADEKSLTTYETNIVTTFQVMDAVMPENSEDSTAPFRKAAKIGETGKSLQTCRSSFSSCRYSTEQIIKMGNQVSSDKALAKTSA